MNAAEERNALLARRVAELAALYEQRALDNRDNPLHGSLAAATIYEGVAGNLRDALVFAPGASDGEQGWRPPEFTVGQRVEVACGRYTGPGVVGCGKADGQSVWRDERGGEVSANVKWAQDVMSDALAEAHDTIGVEAFPRATMILRDPENPECFMIVTNEPDDVAAAIQAALYVPSGETKEEER